MIVTINVIIILTFFLLNRHDALSVSSIKDGDGVDILLGENVMFVSPKGDSVSNIEGDSVSIIEGDGVDIEVKHDTS